MPNSLTKLYSLTEIAQILGIDEKQLHRLAHKGLIDPTLSNDKTARFKDIDCARLRIIKQADELGYESDAIFRLIGKPEVVLDADDSIVACQDFAMAKYKQIYDELNHCEPLEQLNKQCDLRLLIGYIKQLKELRNGAAPTALRQKIDSLDRPSPSVKGVKASIGGPKQVSDGGPKQVSESAPSPSIRRYSVAKYWEYMKKVEELQKEVSEDIPYEEAPPQSAPAETATATDDFELLSIPEESSDRPSSTPFFDDLLDQPEPVSHPPRSFDKQQSWGVWVLTGALLVLLAGGYFLLSSHKGSSPKDKTLVTGTDSQQQTSQAGEPTDGQRLSTETAAPKGLDSSTPLATGEQSDSTVSPVDLQVGDLSLWHDDLNNIYRADFSITTTNSEKNSGPVSGYAFVYLRFGDEASNQKSLLLPSGELQVDKPAQIQRGARFSIRHFKQMQVSCASDFKPGDILHSDVLVYSNEGELLAKKTFDVSVQPFLSASDEPTAPSTDKGSADTSTTPIEPVEPGPPPVAVTEAPPSERRNQAVAPEDVKTEVQPNVASQSEPGPEAQPRAAATHPETGVKEQTIAAIQPDSNLKAPPSVKAPESGVQRALQDSGKSHQPPEPRKPTTRIQSTGNPEAAVLEQKSYDAAVQGDFDQAIENATKAIELDPGRVNPYINRSWAYLEKNMLDEAIQDCKTALSIDPENAFAYNNRGLVYQRKGKTSMAQKDYSAACDLGLELGCQNRDEMTKQSSVAKLIDQSQIAFNSKDWDGVIRITSDVIDLDPQNAVAYTNRSAAYAQKDFLNKALKDSNQALRLNPDFPLAYNNRGYVLELLGNNRQASADYLKSCSLGLDLGCKNFERLNQTQ